MKHLFGGPAFTPFQQQKIVGAAGVEGVKSAEVFLLDTRGELSALDQEFAEETTEIKVEGPKDEGSVIEETTSIVSAQRMINIEGAGHFDLVNPFAPAFSTLRSVLLSA